ncbi:hypothetical protein [Neptuniibacter pectenicola]|jgi:hypothetical protein|uniref:hypothetical protein n=1 Tax=Neptuniibacter pectenicola TaxID=1806669 RepID=UPI0008322D9C|nr:hypothetical protein [Neptuniibacter pectenicola]
MKSVVGYGSLLCERSARETVPGLTHFRIVEVPGYIRIFNKVGVVFFSRHKADPSTRQIASCSTRKAEHATIICSQFECSDEEYLALYEREHRFNWVEVETRHSIEGGARGLMCTTSTDLEYRQHKCQSEQDYHTRVGQYYDGLLWRDDIYPFPRYLAFCLQAAEGLGPDVLNNFLDTSFLADGACSIRSYLDRTPELKEWRTMDTGYHYPR